MTLRACALAATLTLAALTAAPAIGWAQDTPTNLFCAAETTSEINDLLTTASVDDLLALGGQLSSELTADGKPQLAPSATVAQVRTALDCESSAPSATPTPTPSATPESTTPATPLPEEEQDVPTVDSVLAQIAALRCDGTFSEDLGRISDDTFTLAGVTSAERGRITDALNGRLTALGFCVGTPGAETAVDEVTPITGGDADGAGVTQSDVLPSLPAQTGGGPA